MKADNREMTKFSFEFFFYLVGKETAPFVWSLPVRVQSKAEGRLDAACTFVYTKPTTSNV